MEFTVNTIGSTIFQSILLSQEDAVDTFVIKMLTNNEVGGLLPLSVIRKNLDMEVRYNVTSLVPLSQLMQEPMSKQKVMNLLKSLVAAAMQSEEYMLGTEGLVMDISKIYVNPVSGEAWLIYLPIANPYACDMILFVKQLITSLQYDQSEDFSYILHFMNAFNSQTVTTVAELNDFIQFIEKGKRQAGGQMATSSHPQTNGSIGGSAFNGNGANGGSAFGGNGAAGGSNAFGGNGAMGGSSAFGGNGAVGGGNVFGGTNAAGGSGALDGNAEGNPGNLSGIRRGTSSQPAGSMPDAFASGQLPVTPDFPKAHEDKGIKLPLFGKPKASEHKAEKAEEKKAEKSKNKRFGLKEAELKASNQGKKPGFAIPGMNDVSGLPLTPQEEAGIPASIPSEKTDKSKLFVDKLFKPASSKASSAQESRAASAGSSAIAGGAYPEMVHQSAVQPSGIDSVTSSDVSIPVQNANRDYGNTIMINQNNSLVTVMLDENGLTSNEPTRASLTRVSNRQKMYMDKEILKIGKESDYVDFYIGNNPAISRSHADIIKRDGAFYIRDNNSKNHTYVNGKMIVPEQLIPIANNDTIRLANEELIFQLY